jgi:hypothetical protein
MLGRRSALLDGRDRSAASCVSSGIIRRFRSRIGVGTGEQVDQPLQTSRQHPMWYESSGSYGKQCSRSHRRRPPARNSHDRSNNYNCADAYANRQREPIARIPQPRSSSPAQTRQHQTSRGEQAKAQYADPTRCRQKNDADRHGNSQCQRKLLCQRIHLCKG